MGNLCQSVLQSYLDSILQYAYCHPHLFWKAVVTLGGTSPSPPPALLPLGCGIARVLVRPWRALLPPPPSGLLFCICCRAPPTGISLSLVSATSPPPPMADGDSAQLPQTVAAGGGARGAHPGVGTLLNRRRSPDGLETVIPTSLTAD